jgi:hypothetical protein
VLTCPERYLRHSTRLSSKRVVLHSDWLQLATNSTGRNWELHLRLTYLELQEMKRCKWEAVNSYSGGSRIVSRPGHRLSCLMFPPGKCRAVTFKSFPIHQPSCPPTLYSLLIASWNKEEKKRNGHYYVIWFGLCLLSVIWKIKLLVTMPRSLVVPTFSGQTEKYSD